ncbi:hypothetical protein Goshw_003659 [Gossypium schwendimanii]|uniref:Uncharacterized protein n=1 Tax=Gossypium schwendimanii TaxID=34291 RepID=A0A7J9LK60_GOSSC|nr:hypothetical protein [Gossypium schwendimanii]
MSDLIILYGGHVYHVIYRPDESEPMIWSSHDEVQQKLDEYRKMPKLDRLKKIVNKETYLKFNKKVELLGFKPFGSGAIKMGLPHVSSIGSSNIFGAFGNDIWMGSKGKFSGVGKAFGPLKWKI